MPKIIVKSNSTFIELSKDEHNSLEKLLGNINPNDIKAYQPTCKEIRHIINLWKCLNK